MNAEEAPLLVSSIGGGGGGGGGVKAPPPGDERRSDERRSSRFWRPGVASWVVVAQICAIVPILVMFAYLDWDNEKTYMRIEGSFSDNFTAFDSSRWYSPKKPTCQWTEGTEYCESLSRASFSSTFGELNLSNSQSDECGCGGSDATAGHMRSQDYYLSGKVSLEASYSDTTGRGEASNDTLGCVGAYSVLRKWEGTTHNEMTFCWFEIDTPSVHFSWWTGYYLHTIGATLPFNSTELHLYEYEWSDDGFRWTIDGELWYGRSNSTLDCGSGLAFEDEHFLYATYSFYGDHGWVYYPFFGDEAKKTGCDFSHDAEATINQPVQLLMLTRPYTASAVADPDLSSMLRMRKFEYSAFDEGSEEWEAEVDKWSDYRIACEDDVGDYEADGACAKNLRAFKISLRIYTKLFRDALVLMVLGTLAALLLRFARFAMTSTQNNVDNNNNAPEDLSTWTSIGLLGYLCRDLKGAKRHFVYWGSLLAGAMLAVAKPKPIVVAWDRLSLVSHHGDTTTRSTLVSQIVCTFVVMQVFHVVCLAVAKLPKDNRFASNKLEAFSNDPAFVSRIGYIVPCHKSEAEIGRTVRSILDSGISPENVCVVDNANQPTPPDKTREVVAMVHPDVQYVYVPQGLKTNALYVGTKHLPPTVDFVAHLDDDTIIPGADMVYDASRFDDPRVSAVSYGIEIERTGPVQNLVDFEFRLWSHWRYYRARTSTAWYCHGIIGIWRRDRFERAMAQHPFMPFGEDGWLGAIVLCDDQRIEQEMRCAVTTFAPDRLVPAIHYQKRLQGYGASTIFHQRSKRWFVNAPRRLVIRALLWLTYDAGTVAQQLLFRVELLRHVAVTLIALLYPLFVIRVLYDESWTEFLLLKAVIVLTDYLMYATINYAIWDQCNRVALDTVLLYPFYRLFLRLCIVLGHWRCVLWYMPFVEMRTCRYHAKQPKCDFRVLRRWFSNRLLLDTK
ncbi:hypothetical protein CTAYLR_000144 [Chrysophaeum taylorii]|uniref:GH16 domain-containing protein n=1 Tax=Chrysophaeum taylorii TaxID=2483200 RepID=A0AAD7UJ20_9STRA|nr:hypothetical protein CTAYLR_000144 [Chrysophaeum taylorii]